MVARQRLIVVAAPLLALAACAPTLPAPRLYTLSVEAAKAAGPVSSRPIVVGVNPARLPDYLDRAEIVLRDGPNEVRALDGDRWAERLSIDVTRVVAGNLAALLPAASPVMLPGALGRAPELEVTLDILGFDIDPRGTCAITGRWVLSDAAARSEIAGGRIAVTEQAGPGYAAVAAAMSRGLAAISLDIAAAIRATPAYSRGRTEPPRQG